MNKRLDVCFDCGENTKEDFLLRCKKCINKKKAKKSEDIKLVFDDVDYSSEFSDDEDVCPKCNKLMDYIVSEGYICISCRRLS